MRKLITAAALAAFTFTTVAAGPATVADPPEGYEALIELKKGEAATFEGPSGTGGAALGTGGDPTHCGGVVGAEGRCDFILVNALSSGTLDVVFEANYFVADFDVYIFASDEDGTFGEEVARSGNGPGPVDACDPVLGICVSPTESTSFDAKKGHYAIMIEYYSAGGGYVLDVALS